MILKGLNIMILIPKYAFFIIEYDTTDHSSRIQGLP